MSHGEGDAGEWQHLIGDLPMMYVLTRETDGTAVIDACNERFVETLGYDRADLIDRPLTDVYSPASATAFEKGGYERACRGEYTTAERELVRADGTVVHTINRAVPRHDEDDTVVGTRSLFLDVTDRERRRRQVAVLNRLLRHNLRNDMTVVLSHASMLAGELDGEHRRSAERIREMAKRWDTLITKVQRIRKVLSTEVEWSPTDLATVLERVEDQLGDRYPDAKVRILRPPTGLATIRPEIELALLELCENAIHHADDTTPEVVVTVGAPPDEPWVKLTVADDGPAIPETELVPLRDDETTPLLHGTGIGLWMVRLAVDRVGGDVEVVENGDLGTAIRIRYPN
jgi:PAS domain S-box-containing protein